MLISLSISVPVSSNSTNLRRQRTFRIEIPQVHRLIQPKRQNLEDLVLHFFNQIGDLGLWRPGRLTHGIRAGHRRCRAVVSCPSMVSLTSQGLHLLQCEFDHHVLHSLIHQRNDLLRIGLQLMPQLQSRGVCLQVPGIQVEACHSELTHVVQHGNVFLLFGHSPHRAGLFFGHAVGPHAVLLGEVVQEVLERGHGVLDRDIRTPDDAGRAAAQSLRLRGVRMYIREGRLRLRLSIVHRHAVGIDEQPAAAIGRGSKGIGVNVPSARGSRPVWWEARPRGADEQSAATARDV